MHKYQQNHMVGVDLIVDPVGRRVWGVFIVLKKAEMFVQLTFINISHFVNRLGGCICNSMVRLKLFSFKVDA